jgi:outer membrane immunogenic protein
MTGVAAMLASGSAFAADYALPTKKAPPPPVFTWSGCYAGLHVGGDFGHSNWSAPSSSIVGMSTAGALGGGQLGCNYQVNGFVVGGEAEIWGSGLSGSASLDPKGTLVNLKARSDLAGDVALRGGVAFDRALVFVKAGLAMTQYRYDYAIPSVPLSATGRSDDSGLLIGLGLEYALDAHWSLKAEYDYINYGSKASALYVAGQSTGAPLSFANTENIVKAGANYRF